MTYLKPQSPLQHKDGDYFYPLTTVDQVVMPDGSRLNSVFKHTVKKEVILLASDWSNTTPYTQTITVDEYVDDLQVDANIIYSGDLSVDDGLNKAASCLSYIKKNGNEITFYCLKNQPEIDIPIEISYESLNGIATIGTSEEIDLDEELAAQAELIGELQEALQGKMGKGVLDFSIVGGTNQLTNPEENTIWVNTNVEIASWSFGVEEPVNPVEGMVWIITSTSGNVKFDAIKDNDIQLYPISAKQYVDGAWSTKEASIFQNGEWIQFSYIRVYLFKSGEGALAELKTYRESKSTVSIGVDSIEIDYSDTGEYYVISVRTANKMLISGYTSLNIEYTSSKRISSTYAAFGVTATEIKTADVGISWVAKTNITASSSRKTLTVDLTNVSEELYVAVRFGGQMSIYNMWLE